MGKKEPKNISGTGAGSVAIYAAFVPVLVFMAQAAYAETTAGFRNAFLHAVPIIIFGSPIVALIAFAVMLPVAHTETALRVRFCLCVASFIAVALLLTPHLVE